MERLNIIQDSDWVRFLKIMQEYLPDTKVSMATQKRKEYPNVFAGYFKENQLIGIAFGWPRKEELESVHAITLQGIAIESEYKAKGLGSKLIKFWEQQVKAMGYKKVGVGSADGYVEHFYQKNGYRPICYKLFDSEGIVYEYPIRSVSELEVFDREKYIMEHGGNKGFLVLEHEL